MWHGLPVQVLCMRQGAQGWCTGMTQRDGMGREVEGGFRIGNSCTPVADSCRCMAKPIQYCNIKLLNWRLLLYNIVLVLPYINMNPPRVYMCFQSWAPNPSPSPYHPSGSSQYTSSKHHVSCIEPGLAICFLYDIIQVSMPFSQIIPPCPSLTESKRLFYTSVSLLLYRIQGYRYHLPKFHIYVLVYCIGVFLSGLLHSV